MILWMLFFGFFTMHAAQEDTVFAKPAEVSFFATLKKFSCLGYHPPYKSDGLISYQNIRTSEDVIAATRNLNAGYLPLTLHAKNMIAQELTANFDHQDLALQCLHQFAHDETIHPASIAKVDEKIKEKYAAIEYAKKPKLERSISGRRARSQSFHGDLSQLAPGHHKIDDSIDFAKSIEDAFREDDF